jgi:hypothetical protein
MKKLLLLPTCCLLLGSSAWALTPPTGLTITQVSSTTVVLHWIDQSTDESGFKIMRAAKPTNNFSVVAAVPPNTTTYTDNTVLSGTTYKYRVVAYSSAQSSNLVSVTTTGSGPPPPPPPPPYPDATVTGVPAGVPLTRVPQDATSGPGWYWDSRGWVEINTAGTVFDGYQTAATIDVTADNVIVRNVKVNVGGETWGVSVRHAQNVTISNCEIGGIDGAAGRLMIGIGTVYGDEGDISVQKCNIYNTKTGVALGRGLIEDSYIHDMGYVAGDHTNGMTSNVATGPLTIRHNTISNQISQTDAVSLFQDFGSQHDVTVDNNLLAGGGYTIYGGQGATQTYNIVVTNNRISRKIFPNGGYWGPVAYFEKSGPGNVWNNNVWDDNGEAIAAP